jgi:hypothetical protein
MIGNVIAATLPLMRTHAESLMFDRCDIHRLSTTWDEALQKSVTTWTVVHANVPCSLDVPPALTAGDVTDESVTRETPQVPVPVAFDGIEPDDRVTITVVASISDLSPGDVMWVTHAPTGTHLVDRRLECRWTR